eukprot:1861253-Amphidinium_carterae.1
MGESQAGLTRIDGDDYHSKIIMNHHTKYRLRPCSPKYPQRYVLVQFRPRGEYTNACSSGIDTVACSVAFRQ